MLPPSKQKAFSGSSIMNINARIGREGGGGIRYQDGSREEDKSKARRYGLQVAMNHALL